MSHYVDPFLVDREIEDVHHSFKAHVGDLLKRKVLLPECGHIVVRDCEDEPLRWGEVGCGHVIVGHLVARHEIAAHH